MDNGIKLYPQQPPIYDGLHGPEDVIEDIPEHTPWENILANPKMRSFCDTVPRFLT